MELAAISPSDGSFHALVFMLFAQGQKSTLQAQVFAVVTFILSFCHVVYAQSVGVKAITYVSSHQISAQ